MGIAISIFRLVYAAWFVFWGTAPLLGVSPPPDGGGAAHELLEANRGTFSMGLAQASFAIGGLLLVFSRTAPLGIAVLAPTVAWIFLFHLTLTGSVVWGSAWLAGLLLLAWWHRDAFRPLVGLDRQTPKQ